MALSREQLLAELEDVIRSAPPSGRIHLETTEIFSWYGRASAVMHSWDSIRSITFDSHITSSQSNMAMTSNLGWKSMLTMLQKACHELRLETVGPLTVAVGQGGVFDYFDEVRKVIEEAKVDLLFVDPYLDAEFVSRYLPHVCEGVTIRLLGSKKKLLTLLPAVELLRQQNSLTIEVRSADGFHDRYLFVDKQACYQSGASFKDGAKKAPTTLTQITDAFDAVGRTYEEIWDSATSC